MYNLLDFIKPEDPIFERLSLSEKQELLGDKQGFDAIFLREKTVEMAYLLYQKLKDDKSFSSYKIIDVGVGGGWIPILLYRQDIASTESIINEMHGTDIDKESLAYAAVNAKKNQIPLTLHYGNLLEPVFDIINKRSDSNVIISANLPYNTDEEWDTYEDIVRKEPKHGIVGGGEDGLDVFKMFLSQLIEVQDNIHMIFMQGSHRRIQKLLMLCEELHIPGMKFHILADTSGKERFILGTRI